MSKSEKKKQQNMVSLGTVFIYSLFLPLQCQNVRGGGGAWSVPSGTEAEGASKIGIERFGGGRC